MNDMFYHVMRQIDAGVIFEIVSNCGGLAG